VMTIRLTVGEAWLIRLPHSAVPTHPSNLHACSTV
jgi:hypothetical protein